MALLPTPSGTSAFALDKDYEMELSRIAFLSTMQIFGKMPFQQDSAAIDVALNNMKLGTELAEKNGSFTQDEKFIVSQILGGMSTYRMKRMSQKQIDTFTDLTERCITLGKKQLDKELLALADMSGPRWPDAVFKFETRCQYVYELDMLCNLPWNLHWWEQFVYPALEKL